MRTDVELVYKGKAVKYGRMPAHDVAKNITAFADFMAAAAKAAYGEDADVRAEVTGFSKGSFDTNFILDIIGPAVSALPLAGHLIGGLGQLTPSELWAAIKEAFDIWKFLKGRQPVSVTQQGDGNVSIVNNSGDINIYTAPAYLIVKSPQAGKSVEQLVRQALSREGVDAVEIDPDPTKLNSKSTIRVDSFEAPHFKLLVKEESLSDDVRRAIVEIVGPEFKRGRKWRLSERGQEFNAAVEDGDFISRVDGGEKFGKGDTLEVLMREEQRKTTHRTMTDRYIVQVIRRLTPPHQLGFSS